MFKKTMEFDNLDGEKVEQTFYFNYNMKEIGELLSFGRVMQFPAEPGFLYLPLEEQLEKLSTPREESGLTNTENNQQAYMIFQSLILDAFGTKGEDNVTFKKSIELRDYWKSHVAFVEMIFEFLADTQLAAEFIEKCLPAKKVAEAKKELQAENDNRLTSGTISAMVEEAAARQKNSDTAIAAVEGPTAVTNGGSPEVKVGDLTEQDIIEMDDIAFAKIDPQKLSREAMLAAFRRKSQS